MEFRFLMNHFKNGIPMMKSHKRRILFYVPGLISLSILMPLLMRQLHDWGIFKKLYVMEVNWYSPDMADPYARRFPAPRNYTMVNLTGNKANDKVKIEYAKLIINDLASRIDTVNGVRIHLSDTAKFESFIRVLEICDNEEALTYTPYKNDFWVFCRKRPVVESRVMLWRGSCIVQTDVIDEEKNTYAWFLPYDIVKQFWPVFVTLVLLSALSFKKKFRSDRDSRKFH